MGRAPDARRLLDIARRLRNVVRQKGGWRGFAAALRRMAANEGWAGVRRRTAGLYAPHRSAATPFDPETPAHRDDYREWVRRYDQPTAESRARLRAQAAALPVRPVISIVMPTYNPQPRWLDAAIASVRSQMYEHWELCIADDASTDPRVRELLQRHAKEDARIKLCLREKNGHISAASNSAIALATGAWIALLDHDDVLPESALFWVADAIARHPRVRLIYSDEDKITATGERVTPYFKSEWNPELFHAHNLVTHLGVYHADLVREVGGFTVGLEGAQDYDLALRCVERLAPEQIHHIPRVLYHWRMHRESTAQSPDAKPYAAEAGLRALQQHLQRRGLDATAMHTPCGLRVRYALPANPPLVTLVIPTRNGLRLLRRCIDSILAKTAYPRFGILVIDNGSDDPATLDYLQALRAQPNFRVLRDDRPFNYSALNNAGVREAAGELVGLLNNDLEVINPDWLDEMVGIALQPGVGAVGARLLYANGTLQHAGVLLGLGGIAGHAHKHLPRQMCGYFGRAGSMQCFSAVTAACLVMRKALYQEIGGMDEERLAIAFNDVDFCLRLRAAGYRNVWTPFAELYHHESATRGRDDTPQKQARFAIEVQTMKERWGDLLRHDPAYNPNLTLSFEDFSLAWPPRLAPAGLPAQSG
jgi:GT2 family glycosyltransferase